jgi:predicted GNAT superfamily acetyltransferase
MTVVIRPVDTIEGAEHFQTLERMIWQSPPEDAVPVHLTITVVHNGGGLLGAYAADGPLETGGMVGLCFWWPGLGVPTTEEWRVASGDARASSGAGTAAVHDVPFTIDRSVAPRHSPLATRSKMCSHMAGVLPAWQGQGLGLQLKLAQRQAILKQGFADWVTWTYDPLLRTNAVFNIRRLGAVSNSYKVNWYGEMVDGINAGTPSDRLQVDWWLRSARVEACAAGAAHRKGSAMPEATQVVPTSESEEGFFVPAEDDLTFDGRPLALPIPDDIGAIRRADPGLAMAWRLAMRRWLTGAFDAGYVAVDCVNLPTTGWHYLLTAGALMD